MALLLNFILWAEGAKNKTLKTVNHYKYENVNVPTAMSSQSQWGFMLDWIN